MTDWVNNIIQIAAILIPVSGGLLHVLNNIWTTQRMILCMRKAIVRVKRDNIRNKQDIANIKDVLRMKRRNRAMNRDSDTPPDQT